MPMSTSRFPGRTRTAAIALVVVAVAAVGGWRLLRPGVAANPALTASGTIEARVVSLSAELGGRVVEVLVEEGQRVTAEQVLARLDDAALQAAQANYELLAAGPTAEQLHQGQAALAGAQARLEGLKAGPRPEQVAQAEANLNIAKARLAALQRGGRAEQVAQAEANLAAAQSRLTQLRKGPTEQDIALAKLAIDQAKNALWAAQASRDGICGNRNNPKYMCDSANAQVATAETGVQQAQTRLAQAQVQGVEVQLKKVTLASPMDGVVLARSIEPGEVASPGATLFEVGQLSTLDLTVYLPEEQFARVTPGEQATVRVDAYPDRAFTAIVLRIADRAEFTPRNVQTVEGRKNTVFAVRLRIANPDLALKPGMPADVIFAQK